MKFNITEAEDKLIKFKNDLIDLNVEYNRHSDDFKKFRDTKATELKNYFLTNLNHNNILDEIIVFCSTANIYITTAYYTEGYFLNIFKNIHGEIQINPNINYKMAINEIFTITGLFCEKFKNKIYSDLILKVFSENINICNENYLIERKIQVLNKDISNLNKSIGAYKFFKNVRVGFSYDLKNELLNSKFFFYRKHNLDKYKITNSLGEYELNISILDMDEDYIVYCFNNNEKRRKKKTNIYELLQDDFILNKNSVRKTKLKSL